MKKPKICAVTVDNNLAMVREVENFVDLFEVRIDLVGDGWQELAKKLNKPWIASNRNEGEGGQWRKSEGERIEELLLASGLGADLIDIELGTINLAETIRLIKRQAKCLLSFHDLKGTPPLGQLKEIVQYQLAVGADICKVITTAQKFDDNFTVLQLISEFPDIEIISFAMGPLGLVSRILCPLVGGSFTYASIGEGKESASGQIPVMDLYQIYTLLKRC